MREGCRGRRSYPVKIPFVAKIWGLEFISNVDAGGGMQGVSGQLKRDDLASTCEVGFETLFRDETI